MVAANAPQEPDGRQEAEVNEPLELDRYMDGGEWRFFLSHPDPEANRTVSLTEDMLDAFVDVEEWV